MAELNEQQWKKCGYSLDGRVALVTGAAGGLGKAIVAELRERGARAKSSASSC
ncbi:hypothetical protein [Bradyrhizobium cajani]|uniref:hypothetical protein n=1 Tax=Bradyrhizobium cajani TaxID=1928661 RepID=UPI001FEB9B0C|nr:hypothetical protein [Bradyrhizobium cajani]MCP3371788.1 hypothetical protein [Bradyrhizobium cajani]